MSSRALAVGVGAAVAMAGLLVLWSALRNGVTSYVLNDTEVVFEISKGENVRAIAARLHQQGIVRDPADFVALAYWRGDAGRMRFGEYLIPARCRASEVLDLFLSGKVRQHAFTIIEGWTVRQVLAAMAEQTALIRKLSDKKLDEIMPQLGYPAGSAEGRLYPDTYLFPKGYTDSALLRRATERMDSLLAKEWAQRDRDLPLHEPYEGLILASLVEKETARDEERARIAGVFVRRLQKRMRLQTDPTVIYGLGAGYNGNISRRDLVQDNPYNTYTRGGLPPTPIALPGAASLHAAMHPEPGDSLYFVARGDGSHEFSSSLADHERAVARYQLKSHD